MKKEHSPNSIIHRKNNTSQKKNNLTTNPNNISLFTLPLELQIDILSRLNFEEPYVQILRNEPNDEQKKYLTEMEIHNIYHLILINNPERQWPSYRIGFCRKANEGQNVEYVTNELNSTSPLRRLIIEDSRLSKKTTSRDPLLIKYIEREIKKAGGILSYQFLLSRIQIAKVCHQAQNLMDLKDFGITIKQRILNDLFFHVGYGEEDEAKEILKRFPEVLLSENKTSGTDCTRVRHFKNITAFQLAAWNGDWHMYNMMLNVISDVVPKKKLTMFIKDLKNQLDELDKQGLNYKLDNLKACGLRILDQEPTKEMKADVVKRNAYLLIINQEENICSIGFCDPNTKQYTEYELDEESALKNQADKLLNLFGVGCFVRRNIVLLECVRKEIYKHGGRTINTTNSKKEELEPLNHAIEMIKNFKETYDKNKNEYWCILGGWAQRLMPANMWQWWMCAIDCPFLAPPKEKYFELKERWEAFDNYLASSIFPISDGLGRDYSYFHVEVRYDVDGYEWGTRKENSIKSLNSFLQCFRQVRNRKYDELKKDLESKLESQDNHRFDL